MMTFSSIKEIPDEKQGFAATVGNFDGVHLGHQAIIFDLRQAAIRENVKSLVITFEPHPVKVLFPQAQLKNIFGNQDKVKRLEELGVDAVLIEPFSRELSQQEPEMFFKTFVLDLNVKHLFVGHDFNFGRNRAGTLDVLRTLCLQHDVNLKVIAAVQWGGAIVSSSRIRQSIQDSCVKDAWDMLGRPYYMTGVVEKGAGRGKKLGFPTANLFTDGEIFPKNGVYATMTGIGGEVFKSLTNVGVNPTFDGKNRRPIQVETFILDFDRDIYGETIQVYFLDYLRPELKFNSVDQLIAQMHDDVRKARNLKWPKSLF